MPNPFAIALAALHRAGGPCSVAADYTAVGQPTKRIWVILRQGTEQVNDSGASFLADTEIVQIRREDVSARPQAGDDIDLLELDATGAITATTARQVQSDGKLDVESITWDCPLVPITS